MILELLVKRDDGTALVSVCSRGERMQWEAGAGDDGIVDERTHRTLVGVEVIPHFRDLGPLLDAVDGEE